MAQEFPVITFTHETGYDPDAHEERTAPIVMLPMHEYSDEMIQRDLTRPTTLECYLYTNGFHKIGERGYKRVYKKGEWIFIVDATNDKWFAIENGVIVDKGVSGSMFKLMREKRLLNGGAIEKSRMGFAAW